MLRKIWFISLLVMTAFILDAGNTLTRNVKVGDEITVYTTSHSNTQSVLWDWDPSILELQGKLYGSSTSATFKVLTSTPSAGSVIQATTYYYQDDTTSSGINKDVDVWKIYSSGGNSTGNDDNNGNTSHAFILLNKTELLLGSGDFFDLEATIYNGSQESKCTWSSSNPKVVSFSTSGYRFARVFAGECGTATIRVSLSNGEYAECKVEVSPLKFSLNEDGKSYSVSCGKYTIPSTLIVPSCFKDLPVTKILSYGFENRKDVNTIVLPESLTVIETCAFKGCINICSIILPQALSTIGRGAFYKCGNISQMSIPANVKKIEHYAFGDCESLTDFIFEDSPNEITIDCDFVNGSPINNLYIGRNIDILGFQRNYPGRFGNNLEKVHISGFMSRLRDYLFDRTSLKRLEISCPIEIWGEQAFSDCDCLEEVILSEDVQTIGLYAFYDCDALNQIAIPNSIHTIESGAFSYSRISNVLFPESLKRIERHAFKGTMLEEVELPNGLIEIGDYSFSSNKIKTVSLPASLQKIGKGAFDFNQNIQEIYYDSKEPCIADESIFSSEVYENAILYIPNDSEDNYKESFPWCLFKNIKKYDFNEVNQLGNEDCNKREIIRYDLQGNIVDEEYEGMIVIVYSDGSSIKKMSKINNN